MDLSNSFNDSSEITPRNINKKKQSLISINSSLSSNSLYKILSKNPLLINTLDEKQETFLSYAIKRNNKDIIDLILSSPLLNLKYIDKNLNTYLHIAVIQQNIDVVKSLIKKGISINEKNKDGNTALHLAYYLNLTEIIKLLIDNNADINIKNNKGFIPEEIIPTNEIDAIAGYEVILNFDYNYEDELEFDKVYNTIDTTNINKRRESKRNSSNSYNLAKVLINNRKQSVKKKFLFHQNEKKGLRKISNIAFEYNENDKFIRRESDNYSFYIELIDSANDSLNIPTKLATISETNSDNKYNKIRNRSIKIKNKDLYSFLLQIKMEKYYNNFNISILSDIIRIIENCKKNIFITEKDLKNIGINKPGDRAKILIRIIEKADLLEFNIPKAVYYIKENVDDSFEKDENMYKLFLWLKDINLDMYFFNFVNNGYFSIDLLYIQMATKNPLTEEILKNEISIDKLGYRIRIINKLLEKYPEYLNKLKNSSIIDNNKSTKMCNICNIF